MRYIPAGGEAQFESFAVSIKFVTAERKAIPNAARNIPPPLPAILKKKIQMDTKTILITIGIIAAGFILKSCIQKGDRNLNETQRPSESLKPTQLVENDKIIIIKNVSIEDLKTVIKQFCNMYNQGNYRALPLLRKYSESTFVITFPYDIDFETYCYIINYLHYPNGVSYSPQISAWTTTKHSDAWMKESLINKNVMIYIPKEDKEYDNVYLTTSDNIGYKMGFAMGEQSQLLNVPNTNYRKPEVTLNDLNNKEKVNFE